MANVLQVLQVLVLLLLLWLLLLMVILGNKMETEEDCVMRDVNICILCRVLDSESRFIEIRWHVAHVAQKCIPIIDRNIWRKDTLWKSQVHMREKYSIESQQIGLL